jgi:signal transduction histidine kinase
MEKPVANSDLLEKYKIETLERCNQMVRFVTVFVMLGNPTFLILDYFQTTYNIFQFIFVRSFMSIGVIVIYIIARTKYGIKYAMWLGVATGLVCAIDIIILIHMTGGSSSRYYAGLLIVLFALCIWLPITYNLGLLCAISIYLMYILPFMVTNSVMDWSIFLNNNYFIISIFFLSVTSLKFYNDIRFNEFKSRYEIQQSNEELNKVTQELGETNKKLRELDQMKMRFFSNVSHELRTPLTLILGPLEQIMQGGKDMDPVPMLRAMEANAHRLLRQVNTILDFTKSDAGRLVCHYKNGNLGKILLELVQATIPYSKHKNINITISGADNIPDTALDIEKVETIAANLISNALKFTSDNGKISICAGQDKNGIWFEVQDTGMGIPEEKLEQIFERFLQVDDQHSRNNEGTGLGLAMVRELALLHGGKVNVRSKINEGSVFRVELPMKPLSPESDRRKQAGRRKIDKIAAERIDALMDKEYQQRSKINKKTLFADVAKGTGLVDIIDEKYTDNKKSAPRDAHKILVVEDNPDLRAFIASNLDANYLVEQAENGRAGLDLARRMNPDLIISDVMMPEMDGYELCRQIRKDSFLSEVPIILVTAKSGGEAVEAGLEVGATDYIPKPFEMRELRARIAAHLKNRMLEKNISERETRLTAIGQMTSSVVHDLKNPLNAIMGFTQIAQLDSKTLEKKEISKSLSRVMESGHRLNRMINEILEFARGYAPKLHTDSTLLIPFLETTLSNHRDKLATMDITLVSMYEDCDDVQVEFDSDQIHRVIDNLIMNAKEGFFTGNYEAEEKTIWVRAKCEDHHAVIRISDNGPGIPEEIKNSLFEPFTTAGKKSGTGLGLATVRNIVSAHSGKIAVESKGKDGGAVFELKFSISQS